MGGPQFNRLIYKKSHKKNSGPFYYDTHRHEKCQFIYTSRFCSIKSFIQKRIKWPKITIEIKQGIMQKYHLYYHYYPHSSLISRSIPLLTLFTQFFTIIFSFSNPIWLKTAQNDDKQRIFDQKTYDSNQGFTQL